MVQKNFDDIKSSLKDMLVDRLSLKIAPEEIVDDVPLFKSNDPEAQGGLDLDSVEALEIVVGIEERFDVTVLEGDYVEQFYSVNTLARFVEGLLVDAA